jgi:cobalt-zinc-cadmium efflux system protein
MITTETALTCHLVVPYGCPGDSFIAETCHELHHRLSIHHPTLQIELGEHVCALEPNTWFERRQLVRSDAGV